ncbi:MAG: four helix bundle protein [Candidatus Omnitrophica bacterium]|nr:four helix bundle protein [Candidatus Omnitrophota bacterium]MBI2496010.1 four helix bundle protein [Candidatus Omnitrophota bacterium]MBI3020457.1 four helix bundle protein [Candidatus Omnitrophota bacterium]MBI3083921.1 four helix bundle protein [Candidatus Omnitrophota bacterium]
MKTNSFKDLIVWQKAYQSAREVYEITKRFPPDETYGLVQQMRRAAVAIPSNIAEGYGRQSTKEYRHFLSIAYGSLCELETQCSLSIDLGYCKRNEVIEGLLKEVGRMLYRMLHPSQ